MNANKILPAVFILKEYFDFLQAPEKYFFTFESSARSPLFEEPGQTAEIIKLIKETENQ